MSERPILIWQFADLTEQTATGSDDGLVLGHVCYVVSSNTFYYASTVNATTSAWTATATGSGQTLAATLAVGNVTGGTGLVVSVGDPVTMGENAAVPGGAPAAGFGKLWVRNDAPNELIFTDDAGTDHSISTMGSGDVVGPGASTDNALVRFNLTTGKLVQDSVGILGDTGDLSGINDITLTGTVDGRDVAADGAALDAHVADVANPHVTTLALALASGATTGGTGIEVSTSDPLTLNENATVPGGAPAAGKGKVWVRNDSPNVLIFTDDGGTDTVLGGTGTVPSLSQVLSAGNTTSGDDVLVDSGSVMTFSTTGTDLDDTSGSFTIATADAQGVTVDTSGGAGPITLTPGGALVLDYATFPASDGTTNYFLKTDGAGTLSWAAAMTATSTLADVLAAGNVTGGMDIVLTSGDAYRSADGSTSAGATLQLLAGAGDSGNGGALQAVAGDADGGGNIGGNALVKGGAGTSGGTGGHVRLQGGEGLGGTGGPVQLLTGSGTSANPSGDITLTTGAGGTTGDSGTIAHSTGNAGASGGDSGSITFTVGTAASGTIGTVQITNTALDITESPGVPAGTPGASVGRWFVKSDAPNTPHFMDDTGVDGEIVRVRQTALDAGDFALSAGWGTTASVSAIAGTDSRFLIEISPTGTGQAQNPTITLTYTDGAWANAPFPMLIDNGSVDAGGGFFGPLFELTSRTTTTAVWTLRSAAANGSSVAYTPNANDTFKMICHVLP